MATRRRTPLLLRRLEAEAEAVRALVDAEIARSRYQSAPRGALEAVIAGADPDARAHIALGEDLLVGVIIYGVIAGSEGAGRLQLVVTAPAARRTGVATALVDQALRDLQRDGARFAIVELPDDPALHAGRALLQGCGFSVEARVPDFFRDGVDLLILRRELPQAP